LLIPVMTDWSADPWFAQHAWVAPRVGETRRSGFKSLRPHSSSLERREISPNFAFWTRDKKSARNLGVFREADTKGILDI